MAGTEKVFFGKPLGQYILMESCSAGMPSLGPRHQDVSRDHAPFGSDSAQHRYGLYLLHECKTFNMYLCIVVALLFDQIFSY